LDTSRGLMAGMLAVCLLAAGCVPQVPNAVPGTDGEPVLLEDVARIQQDPQYEDDDARLQALLDLGVGDVLARYFLDHDVSDLVHQNQGSVFVDTYDETVQEPAVEITNAGSVVLIVSLRGLMETPAVYLAELSPGESKTWIVPPGTYVYSAVKGASTVVAAGRETFRLSYRYTWSAGF